MNQTKDDIIDNLRNVIAGVYETESSEVDINATFLEMGLDSISIIQVKQLVKNTYAFDIPVDRLFDDVDNLDKLAGFILQKLPPGPAEVAPAQEPEKTAEWQGSLPVLTNKIPAAINFHSQSGDDTGIRQIISDQVQVMNRQMEILSKMSN
jgi:iturin family lipopeptide synthetase A